jgi:arabinose-5-phosphate isomerase
MTKTPRTLHEDALVRDALQLIREFRQDEIPLVDDHGRPVGILDVQDVLALKVARE